MSSNITAPTPKNADLKHRLIIILENLLASGDWENSLFLRNAKKRLIELKEEAATLGSEEDDSLRLKDQFERLPEGAAKVYISLYQIDGNNLQSWAHTVRSLANYNISRPTYFNLLDIRELINSKADVARHAYVIVTVNKNDIIDIEPKPVDTLGHELLILKEGAVRPENITEFVHANKRRYVLENNSLVYKGTVEI